MIKHFYDFTPDEQKIIMRDYKKAIAKANAVIRQKMKTPHSEFVKKNLKGNIFIGE